MQDNSARMKDVELLSGLRLAAQNSTNRMQMRLLTHLTVGLWDRLSWADAFSAEDNCPDIQTPKCPSGWVL